MGKQQGRTTMNFRNLFMILKLTVLVILLGLYFQFFFIGVFNNYNEGLTNMATKQEQLSEVDGGIELPAISICLSPLRKPSKMQELNITESFFILLKGSYEHLDDDLVMDEVIEETSFKLGEDFQIEFGQFLKNTVTFETHPLQLGNNSFPNYYVSLVEFISMHKGKCYLLTSNVRATSPVPLILSVTLSDNAKEYPDHVTLMATSKYDYLGNIMGSWKSLKPMTTQVNFEGGLKVLDLAESYTYLISNCDNTVDSFQLCIREGILDLMNKSKECEKCTSMMSRSLLDTTLYPRCETLTDEACNVQYFARESAQVVSNCKIQCNIIEYTAQVDKSSIEVNDYGNRSADVMIMHTSALRTVTKEYLIYDAPGMVGNVGGSLGLFLGFSFFGFFSDFLDLLRNKLNR